MLENTNTKQFYPGPILNRTLEITTFLFRNPEQVKLQKTALDEAGKAYNIDLIYGTDYEVQKVLPNDINIEDANLTASTGKITLKNTVTVAQGEKLTAYRESALIQDVDYPRTGKFPAASHEGALDYLTMQNQEQQDQIDRSLKVPISVNNFDANMPIPAANRSLKTNSTGTGLELSDYDFDEVVDINKSIRDEITILKNQSEQASNTSVQARDEAIQAKNTILTNPGFITVSNDLVAEDSKINTVASNINTVRTTAENIANINIVKNNIPSINTTAENINNINAVNANKGNINTVVSQQENIIIVATNMQAVQNAALFIQYAYNSTNGGTANSIYMNYVDGGEATSSYSKIYSGGNASGIGNIFKYIDEKFQTLATQLTQLEAKVLAILNGEYSISGGAA